MDRVLGRGARGVLGLVIAIGIAGGLLAAVPGAADASTVVVTTWTTLATAFGTTGTATLGASISAPSDRSLVVGAGTTVTLDLAGRSLTIASPGTAHAAIEVFGALTVETTTNGSGTLIVTGGPTAAGIGGDATRGGGTVVVSGGTIRATGGSKGSAIGGGKTGAGGVVTISGGTLHATGGATAAAIGGGSTGSGRVLRNTGGTIRATGGSKGAAIGGGRTGAGGTVTITAGTTHATGGANGAGIGGGDGGAGGTVTITGGTVHAMGDRDGAGIGGGARGAGADVTIGARATVTTTGATASGIGAGETSPTFGSLVNSGALTFIGHREVIPASARATNTTTGTITLQTKLAGAGTLVNEGSMIVRSAGTVGTSLTITRHDYVVSFTAQGHERNPASRTVYATSFAKASMRIPAPPSGDSWMSASKGGSSVTDATSLPALFSTSPSGPTRATVYLQRLLSATTTTLSLPAGPVAGSRLTFSVGVASTTAAPTRATVVVRTRSSVICSVTRFTTRGATIIGSCTAKLSAGTYDDVSALYPGSTSYAASTSASHILVVGSPSPPVSTPPAAPPAPPGTTSPMSAASSTLDGTAAISDGPIGVEATATGWGAMTIAGYTTNPTGIGVRGATDRYFFVAVARGSAFRSLALRVRAGSGLSWFNGSTWQRFSDTRRSGSFVTSTLTAATSPAIASLTGGIVVVATSAAAPAPSQGYVLSTARGGIVARGSARNVGTTAATGLASPVIGIAAAPHGHGYWLAERDGVVLSFGDAHFYGDQAGLHLTTPFVSIVANPGGHGYWLVTSNGRVFRHGAARFYGSAKNVHLPVPVSGMAATRTGKGYWLVARNGRVIRYGTARFYGSGTLRHLTVPFVGIVPTTTSTGYWLVTSNGRVFRHGAARFYGSAARVDLPAPIVGMAVTQTGHGYWLVTSNGRVFSYGAAREFRVARPRAKVVGIAG